jgi:FkbM family methyltransferase
VRKSLQTIPKIIHFAIPDRPSPFQMANIEVARDLHPDWTIEVWQTITDKSNFRLARYWDRTNSSDQKADLIGMEAVFNQGGFYLDSALTLHRNLDPLRNYQFVIASDEGTRLTNAFFGGVSKAPLLQILIDTLDRKEVDWVIDSSLTTGPYFFTRELKWREGVTVTPRETFQPCKSTKPTASMRQWTYGTYQSGFSRSRIRALASAAKALLKGSRQRILGIAREFLRKMTQLSGVNRPQSFSASSIICAQTLHGPKIYLLGEDASVTPEIALHGTYEVREERFVKRVLRPGDWAIDVGANVGMLSLIFAQRVGSFGRVFCYEPNPLPAALLRRSLVMNWFHDRAEVRQKALGSKAAVMQLRFDKGRLGDATLAAPRSGGTFERSISFGSGTDEIDVEVSTLDEQFPVDLPIRIAKIDAEGFEHHILRGGSRLFERRCIDILMLECLQEVFGNEWDQFVGELDKLIQYGYSPYMLTSSSTLREITLKDILYSERGRNVIFVANTARETIRELA